MALWRTLLVLKYLWILAKKKKRMTSCRMSGEGPPGGGVRHSGWVSKCFLVSWKASSVLQTSPSQETLFAVALHPHAVLSCFMLFTLPRRFHALSWFTSGSAFRKRMKGGLFYAVFPEQRGQESFFFSVTIRSLTVFPHTLKGFGFPHWLFLVWEFSRVRASFIPL